MLLDDGDQDKGGLGGRRGVGWNREGRDVKEHNSYLIFKHRPVSRLALTAATESSTTAHWLYKEKRH